MSGYATIIICLTNTHRLEHNHTRVKYTHTHAKSGQHVQQSLSALGRGRQQGGFNRQLLDKVSGQSKRPRIHSLSSSPFLSRCLSLSCFIHIQRGRSLNQGSHSASRYSKAVVWVAHRTTDRSWPLQRSSPLPFTPLLPRLLISSLLTVIISVRADLDKDNEKNKHTAFKVHKTLPTDGTAAAVSDKTSSASFLLCFIARLIHKAQSP